MIQGKQNTINKIGARCRIEKRLFLTTSRQTQRRELRKMDKAGGTVERQLVGEARQTQRLITATH